MVGESALLVSYALELASVRELIVKLVGWTTTKEGPYSEICETWGNCSV